MRFNFRIKIANLTFFTMIARTQTLEGITSLQKDTKHIVLMDLDGCSLEKAECVLRDIQDKYCLSHFYIVSDAENSFRVWCFSKVDFNTYLKILVDCISILDYNFFYYTVKRRKATLRTGTKKGRIEQQVVSVLESFYVPVVDGFVERVVYDTGLEKRGFSLLLGGD